MLKLLLLVGVTTVCLGYDPEMYIKENDNFGETEQDFYMNNFKGQYRYSFQNHNKIKQFQDGFADGGKVGFYAFVGPDGRFYVTCYTAVNGYRAKSIIVVTDMPYDDLQDFCKKKFNAATNSFSDLSDIKSYIEKKNLEKIQKSTTTSNIGIDINLSGKIKGHAGASDIDDHSKDDLKTDINTQIGGTGVRKGPNDNIEIPTREETRGKSRGRGETQDNKTNANVRGGKASIITGDVPPGPNIDSINQDNDIKSKVSGKGTEDSSTLNSKGKNKIGLSTVSNAPGPNIVLTGGEIPLTDKTRTPPTTEILVPIQVTDTKSPGKTQMIFSSINTNNEISKKDQLTTPANTEPKYKPDLLDIPIPDEVYFPESLDQKIIFDPTNGKANNQNSIPSSNGENNLNTNRVKGKPAPNAESTKTRGPSSPNNSGINNRIKGPGGNGESNLNNDRVKGKPVPHTESSKIKGSSSVDTIEANNRIKGPGDKGHTNVDEPLSIKVIPDTGKPVSNINEFNGKTPKDSASIDLTSLGKDNNPAKITPSRTQSKGPLNDSKLEPNEKTRGNQHNIPAPDSSISDKLNRPNNILPTDKNSFNEHKHSQVPAEISIQSSHAQVATPISQSIGLSTPSLDSNRIIGMRGKTDFNVPSHNGNIDKTSGVPHSSTGLNVNTGLGINTGTAVSLDGRINANVPTIGGTIGTNNAVTSGRNDAKFQINVPEIGNAGGTNIPGRGDGKFNAGVSAGTGSFNTNNGVGVGSSIGAPDSNRGTNKIVGSGNSIDYIGNKNKLNSNLIPNISGTLHNGNVVDSVNAGTRFGGIGNGIGINDGAGRGNGNSKIHSGAGGGGGGGGGSGRDSSINKNINTLVSGSNSDSIKNNDLNNPCVGQLVTKVVTQPAQTVTVTIQPTATQQSTVSVPTALSKNSCRAKIVVEDSNRKIVVLHPTEAEMMSIKERAAKSLNCGSLSFLSK